MQKKSLIALLLLGLSSAVLAEDVAVNGQQVSLAANKTPINTPANPAAVAQIPAGQKFAVPGSFTVAVAALNSPPLTVFSDDNKTLLGSEVDIARLVADSLGLKLNIVPTSWEDWPLGITVGRYDVAMFNIAVTEERKQKFDFAIYRADNHAFAVKADNKISAICRWEDMAGKRIILLWAPVRIRREYY